MKKVFRKNQIIITALAIMIVVAGYLNFTGQEISTQGLVASNQQKQEKKIQAQLQDETVVSPEATEEKEKNSDGKKEEKDDKVAVETGGSVAENETDVDLSAEEVGDEQYVVKDDGEVVSSKENPGEAVMVSGTIGSDFFSSAKLSREQSRAKNKEELLSIINNKDVASSDKQVAVKQMAEIADNAEKENAAELLLEAKGFQDAVVSVGEGKADVVINAEKLTQQDIAQIEDIVKRKTGISGENIVITPVAVEEE